MLQEINVKTFALPCMNILPLPENAFDSLGNQPLILIYSHEADTRFLFRTLLEMWNYRVVEAENLEDSIFAIETENPNLILMDTTISLVENLTMMRKLRESKTSGEIPFILLSGHAQAKFRQMAMTLGANDFLVKPVDFDLLEKSLKKNIKNRLHSNV